MDDALVVDIIPEPKFLASPSIRGANHTVQGIIPEPKFLASPSRTVGSFASRSIIPEPKFLASPSKMVDVVLNIVIIPEPKFLASPSPLRVIRSALLLYQNQNSLQALARSASYARRSYYTRTKIPCKP